MYVYKLFFSFVGVTFFESVFRCLLFLMYTFFLEVRSHDFKLTLKRMLIFTVLASFCTCLIIWNHIGFFLDDIFFPEWKQQEIKKPLFIVGNARSGTTWLHRLLALKSDTFSTLKTWEILFAASVTWRKLFLVIYDQDQRLFRGLVFSSLLRLEKIVIGSIDIHPIGLMKAEEDEWIMVHIFLSQLIMLFFPLGGALLFDLAQFDDVNECQETVPQAIKKTIFTYYRDCIKRHLYAHGNSQNLVFLSKNPPFTMRLQTLLEFFPDCRIVCIVRDPMASIPSMVSYIGQVWSCFSTPCERSDSKDSKSFYPSTKNLVSLCFRHYLYPLEIYQNLVNRSSTSQKDIPVMTFVSYSDLKTNLSKNLLELMMTCYNDDISADLVFSKKLQSEHRRTEAFQSKHLWSIEKCCDVTEEELRSMLSDVYDNYRKLNITM